MNRDASPGRSEGRQGARGGSGGRIADAGAASSRSLLDQKESWHASIENNGAKLAPQLGVSLHDGPKLLLLMNTGIIDFLVAAGAVLAAVAVAAVGALGLVVWLAGGKLGRPRQR